MDQGTLNIIVGAILAALGWFARMLWDRQEALARDLAATNIMMARDYVSNTKLAQAFGEVRDELRYIRERIDHTPQRRQGDQP